MIHELQDRQVDIIVTYVVGPAEYAISCMTSCIQFVKNYLYLTVTLHMITIKQLRALSQTIIDDESKFSQV